MHCYLAGCFSLIFCRHYLAELILAVGHFPGSFAKISKLTEITFVKNHQISEKSSVLLNLVRCWNSVHPLDDFFAQCRLLWVWKGMRFCLRSAWPFAFLCIVVRQVLQQLWLLMALIIRNPTKHTVSGARTDLRWACRNTLCGATFQAYQLYMASSRRPPHMRKAENSGFSNASGRNLQNY